jgi:hypothetical protein
MSKCLNINFNKRINIVLMVNPLLFFTKYIFRTLHVGSVAIFTGNYFFDYFFGKRLIEDTLTKSYLKTSTILGVILVVSGLVSMIIQIIENKFIKNFAYEFWKKILIAKFFIACVALTPLINKIISPTLIPDEVARKSQIFNLQCYVIFGLFLISPFLRFFREYYMLSSNKKIDDSTKSS